MKIVQLNTLKVHRDRPLQLCRKTVVVDDEEDNLEGTGEPTKIVGGGTCLGFNRNELDQFFN